MVQYAYYKDVLVEISCKEQQVSMDIPDSIREAAAMASFLHGILLQLRKHIITNGFVDNRQEIEFFKEVKPQVLGKLIFYNKIYRLETNCPFRNGKMYHKFFSAELQQLKEEFRTHVQGSDFYRYYRSGRKDCDNLYFKLGNLQHCIGLNSFIFEADPNFSTYYDYKVARIIASDLLYGFLMVRANPELGYATDNPNTAEICWTGTKNALIELIYALHISGSISHGKLGLRKLSMAFQSLFRTRLGDIHHAFHRMKDRAGQRTLFIDQLQSSLEQYMDKDL